MNCGRKQKRKKEKGRKGGGREGYGEREEREARETLFRLSVHLSVCTSSGTSRSGTAATKDANHHVNWAHLPRLAIRQTWIDPELSLILYLDLENITFTGARLAQTD